ncbi:MAG: hypothetical protein Q7S58_05610 [Candidatus Binatus sp.]|uniref:hypothetical protein n=1 Tax=Candidatus Binatus sp. TaxID=2811406 RepID=UPI00272440AF|nr:hypothetical protein [Candidatus Binatus sp.]MDO8431872.1 hypothetical protein [Candidatus Binatus sp.]
MSKESRLKFSADEILANVPVKEPLIVNGVKCHGGFDDDGRYRSPRTLMRVPAIKAWQEQHRATSGMALVEIPADTIPPYMPNAAQAKFLLRSGVREPMVRTLTEIAIVEGFGAMIRELPVPPLKSFIRENTEGTALAHLTTGLFEAHARDEAGWSEEGGHRQMWEAARDAALSKPEISSEIFASIMTRRGPANPPALFPELGEGVERLIRFMVNVLAIEVFAASTFAWAEEVLSDPEVSDAPDDTARLVRFIRSDEAPHVEYLRTALSEIAARTILTLDGKPLAANVVVDQMMDRSIRMMLRTRINDRPMMIREVIRRTAKVNDVEELMRQFDALGTSWTPPSRFADVANQSSATVG